MCDTAFTKTFDIQDIHKMFSVGHDYVIHQGIFLFKEISLVGCFRARAFLMGSVFCHIVYE